MKEIPMLFSTPMVQALLAGRKTVTRRLVQPMRGRQSEWLTPELINSVPHGEIIKGGWQMHHPKAGQNHAGVDVAYDSPLGWIECPYGQPGDLIWVRETYKIEGSMSHGESVLGVKYKADGRWIQNDSKEVFEIFHKSKEGWRPNIFLPKVAARIWLQVTDIRVERLQDITEQDAQAEGMEKIDESIFCWRHYGGKYAGCSDARTSFQSIWQSINGDESWNSNPWVWVNSFNVLSTTGKPSLLTEKID